MIQHDLFPSKKAKKLVLSAVKKKKKLKTHFKMCQWYKAKVDYP